MWFRATASFFLEKIHKSIKGFGFSIGSIVLPLFGRWRVSSDAGSVLKHALDKFPRYVQRLPYCICVSQWKLFKSSINIDKKNKPTRPQEIWKKKTFTKQSDFIIKTFGPDFICKTVGPDFICKTVGPDFLCKTVGPDF